VTAAVLLAGCLLLGSPSARTAAQAEDTLAALVEALDNSATLGQVQRRALLTRSFNRFRAEVAAQRPREALPLARAMHNSAQATWSAMSMALLQTRLGLAEDAAATLREQLARTPSNPDRRDLQERLGLAYLGAGRRGPALGALGRSWLAGSTNAGQVLGALALSAGRTSDARRVFGSLLPPLSPAGPSPAPPWALRGWGLAMVGGANQPVASGLNPVADNSELTQEDPASTSLRATSRPSLTTR
jgi:hypothetical protein